MPTPSLGQLTRATWKDFITHWVVFIAIPTLWMLGFCGLIYEANVRINEHYKSYEDIAVVGAALLLIAAIVIVWSLLWVYYGGAVAYWGKELHQGKTRLQFSEGIKSATTHLPANLWTGLLKQIKIFLWSMLFVFPGIYKSITYSKALSISQLENVHGAKAHHLSELLVNPTELGRVALNKYATAFAGMVLCGFLFSLGAIPFSMIFPTPYATTPAPWITGVGFLFVGLLINILISFLILQNTHEYLYLRDEQKANFEKALKKIA